MSVPPDERQDRCEVDRRRVDPETEPPRLVSTIPVQSDPAVLLPHEVKHREVREQSPENQRAILRVHRPANRERDGGREQVETSSSSEFHRIEVDAKSCRPDVGHVDEQNRCHPRPFGRVTVQNSELVSDRQQCQREQGAAQKSSQIDRRREQPGNPVRRSVRGRRSRVRMTGLTAVRSWLRGTHLSDSSRTVVCASRRILISRCSSAID